MGVTSNGLKARSTPWFLTGTLAVVLCLTWFSLEAPALPYRLLPHRPSPPLAHNPDPKSSIRALLRSLYRPSTTVDAHTFQDFVGKKWNLTSPPTWTEPLGRRLCIVDIDTRPLDDVGQILDKSPLDWDTTDPLAAGMLNHYIYAMIHGYDYHFIQAEEMPDRAVYWSKPMALSRVLEDYDVCISIDADAIFTHLSLPFEWLLNRWDYKKGETSIAMALDPSKSWNLDSRNRTSINAGFVVAQNLERTHDMLRAWTSCPDDEARFPNCSQWKDKWPAEQRAFADYIRYEYDRPGDVLEIPCTEGNGYPEAGQGCDGTFVRHYWLKKGELLKPGVTASLAQALLSGAHDSLLRNNSGVVVQDQADDQQQAEAV